jgi:Cu2+-exporting ATPase
VVGRGAGTRDLFHWISAAIALPALAYSGRSSSPRRGRRCGTADQHGRADLDRRRARVRDEPLRHDRGQPHAYFDASVSLLFFLLVGRTLDHAMRERARAAVTGLRRLVSYGATVVGADGSRDHVPVGESCRA